MKQHMHRSWYVKGLSLWRLLWDFPPNKYKESWKLTIGYNWLSFLPGIEPVLKSQESIGFANEAKVDLKHQVGPAIIIFIWEFQQKAKQTETFPPYLVRHRN